MIDTIIIGDSTKKIKALPDNFVHAIISDIPYGICYEEWDVLHNNTNSALGGASFAQKDAGDLFKRRGKPLNGWSSADKNIAKEYQNWCSSWAPDWLRVLKSGGSCFIFAGRRYAHRCISALEDAGFTFKDMLAWEKSAAPHRAQRISEVYKRRGDSKSAEKWSGWRVANLRPLFEPILWFQKPYKTGGTLADNLLEFDVGAWNEQALSDYNQILGYSDGATQSNIIRISANKDDRGLHETQKPLKLMELLISLVTKKDAIILDPFAGSGTTCVAAKQLERHYIGMEIDETYAKIATDRLTECVNGSSKRIGVCTEISLFDIPEFDLPKMDEQRFARIG
ncbi:MAG: site-specific DNA-methyltransferase [Chitinispirillia bacterium]|nr:site-specific DNA-methyltransferase [Chitinispirillia bacterium]MCL2241762.1 site-specific DNA-methyltransferase [Chitinispirillia bacterium]